MRFFKALKSGIFLWNQGFSFSFEISFKNFQKPFKLLSKPFQTSQTRTSLLKVFWIFSFILPAFSFIFDLKFNTNIPTKKSVNANWLAYNYFFFKCDISINLHFPFSLQEICFLSYFSFHPIFHLFPYHLKVRTYLKIFFYLQ